MNLDSNYTFDSFVSGKGNSLAKEISCLTAKSPADAFNPLFIYGDTGLGKTHLIQAIGNYIINNSDKKVLYITCEKLIEELLDLYLQEDSHQALEEYKRKYYDIDVLLVDDIQYLEIAPKAQQEFYDIFNIMFANHRQIVITSDKAPRLLKNINDRLKATFNWGLSIDIEVPNLRTRKAILDEKIERQKINCFIPNEVRNYIATNFTNDIRKMVGALVRLIAYASMTHKSQITLGLAEELLKDYITMPAPSNEPTSGENSKDIVFQFERLLGRSLSSLELELIDAIDIGIASQYYLNNILLGLKRKEIKYE